MKCNLRRYAVVALMSATMGVPLAFAADKPAKVDAKAPKAQKAAEKKNKADAMDYGPFLSASFVSSPKAEFENGVGSFSSDSTARGIIIKLDKEWNAGMVFDADTMRMSAGWTGGPIWFRGLIGDGAHGWDPMPKVPPTFQTPSGPGWADPSGSFEDPRPDSIAPLPRPGPLPHNWAHYNGLYRHGEQVVLSYSVNGANVLESPSFTTHGTANGFVRTIHMESSKTPTAVMIADGDPVIPAPKPKKDKQGKEVPAEATAKSFASAVSGMSASMNDLHIAVIHAPAGAQLQVDDKKRLSLKLPANAEAVDFAIVIGGGGEATKADFATLAAEQKQPANLIAMTKGGPSLWAAEIETKGVVAEAKPGEAYVVDNLTIPYENPYNSWMRVAAMDFFADGTKAAVTTWSGDVWVVSGIDEKLEHLKWKRFATGLHQPLGLKIVDETIYVVGHDQITRLRDLDGDGEADFYENFNNDWELTTAFHAFAFDLQTDKDGNFYFAFGSPVHAGGGGFQKITKDHGTLFKVSKDGSKIEHYAEGLRAPNGIGVNPVTGQVTAGDNQGSWVPYDPLIWVKPGAFLGVAESAHRPMKSDLKSTDPTEMPKPLCWLPYKELDNSNGGQAWVTSDKWGPFKDELLYCSYGKSALFKVLKEEVNGVMQGGVAKITAKFTSSAMRPRFNPKDGQLYITGMKGWQTNAGKDGGFDRVRYTGAPVNIPTAAHVTKKGIAITFTSPLQTATANDASSFTAEAWNIKWSSAYGSADYPLSANPWDDKAKKGRDPWAVKSSTLSADGKTVFLEIPDIKKANIMLLKYSLDAADGAALKGDLSLTIHELADQ